jgi:coatomer protein complex subunit gamma
MEYVVTCVKHIFATHVVLQFSILNTIDDQRLRDVRVDVESSDPESYTVESVITAPVARYGERVNCYVSLARTGDPAPVSVTCELHFKVVQVDPATGEVEGDEQGYDEEYPLEGLEISTNDYMAKVSLGEFKRAWEQSTNEGEVLVKFALQFKKLEEAVAAIIEFLGMQPADGTGVVPTGARTHTVHLSGIFVGNVPVLVRAQLNMDDVSGVVLKMAVRSESKDISQLVAECIR